MMLKIFRILHILVSATIIVWLFAALYQGGGNSLEAFFGLKLSTYMSITLVCASLSLSMNAILLTIGHLQNLRLKSILKFSLPFHMVFGIIIMFVSYLLFLTKWNKIFPINSLNWRIPENREYLLGGFVYLFVLFAIFSYGAWLIVDGIKEWRKLKDQPVN
jgi:hypothetical protein